MEVSVIPEETPAALEVALTVIVIVSWLWSNSFVVVTVTGLPLLELRVALSVSPDSDHA